MLLLWLMWLWLMSMWLMWRWLMSLWLMLLLWLMSLWRCQCCRQHLRPVVRSTTLAATPASIPTPPSATSSRSTTTTNNNSNNISNTVSSTDTDTISTATASGSGQGTTPPAHHRFSTTTTAATHGSYPHRTRPASGAVRVALVFGREELGMSDEEVDACDLACSIPIGRLQVSCGVSGHHCRCIWMQVQTDAGLARVVLPSYRVG